MALEPLISAVIWLIILGLIFWLLMWAVDSVGIPEPIHKVAKILLIVVFVLILVYFLVGLLPAPGHIRLSQ